MAEALLSKQHFYVNCQFYNDTEEDQDATIHVEDTQDILKGSDNWMVHVTRFSVDSMVSLPYTEVDQSASWEIRLYDEHSVIKKTFTFVIDRHYMTAQDLVGAMNMSSRFILPANRLPAFESGRAAGFEVEAYRFEIDTANRFKLVTQPENQMPHWYITYAGTASMNKLLGFKNSTSTIRFTPSATDMFCRAVDYIHSVAIKQYHTEFNVSNWDFLGMARGTVYRQRMNRILVNLLNGLEIQHLTYPGNARITTDPITSASATWKNGVLFKQAIITKRGAPPQSVGNSTDDAIIPKGNSRVLCEWYDKSIITTPEGNHNGAGAGNYNVHDSGFKVNTAYMNWDSTHPYSTGSDVRIKFRDIQTSTSTDTVSMVNFPGYNPGDESFSQFDYVYPMDSLPGQVFSSSSTNVVTIDTVDVNRSTFTFNGALPGSVEVGMDIWLECIIDMTFNDTAGANETSTPHKKCFSTFQIVSIDRTDNSVVVDQPLSNLQYAAYIGGHDGWPDKQAMITDRRVPFQPRSRCTFGMNSGFAYGDDNDEVLFLMADHTITCNAGDVVYIIHDNVVSRQGFEVTLVTRQLLYGTHIFARGDLAASTFGNLVQKNGNAVPNRFGLFIHRKAVETVRWARDAINLKMAPTTFSYHGHQYNPHEGLVPEVALRSPLDHGIVYNQRRLQGHDEAILRRQVVNTIKEIQAQQLAGALASDEASITIGEIVELLPQSFHNMPPGKVLPGSRTFDMGLTSVNDPKSSAPVGVGKVAASWGFGSNNLVLPQPYYILLSQDESIQPAAKKVWDFVSENPGDKPLVVAIPNEPSATTVEWYPTSDRTFENPNNEANDLLVGVTVVGTGYDEPFRHTADDTRRRGYIYWAPPFPIGESGETQTMPVINPALDAVMADEAEYSVQFKNHGRTYQIARKETQDLALVAGVHTKLYGYDGDFLKSHLPSQTDLSFPYSQLVITSTDLNQVPERDSSGSSTRPILSSYTLHQTDNVSVDKYSDPAGGTSQPWGDVHFSEQGSRRFHHLSATSGGLRQFKMSAEVTFKDPKRVTKKIKLPPGGRFKAQILFIRKMPE